MRRLDIIFANEYHSDVADHKDWERMTDDEFQDYLFDIRTDSVIRMIKEEEGTIDWWEL